jgi:SAM-dependent methyltransferase
MTDEETFGEGYFDSGISQEGRFAAYKLSSLAPYFETLANILKAKWNPRRVLDVGCAKGFLVYALRNVGIESYGVDVSDYALSQSPRETRPYLTRVNLESDKLPFSDAHFDLVIALGVIEYLKNYKNMLSQITRVIQHNGIFMMKTIYKTRTSDKYRVNVHNKGFWITQLESYGFHHILDDKDKEMLWTMLQEKLSLGVRGHAFNTRLVKKTPRWAKWALMKYYAIKTKGDTSVMSFRADKKTSCY